MINNSEQMVYKILDELKIKYIRYEHIPVFTIDEASELKLDTNAQHCKNLFIRNRKGDKHYLVILDESKKADLKQLAAQIESTILSFASEERLFKFLGLTPGSVTPFGLINDSEREVIVIIDEDLKACETICFHPNVNTSTIEIMFKDFERYLKWCGNKVIYVKI